MFTFFIGFLCGAAAGTAVTCLTVSFHNINKKAAKLAEKLAADAGMERKKR